MQNPHRTTRITMKRLLILCALFLASCDVVDFEKEEIRLKSLKNTCFWELTEFRVEMYDLNGQYIGSVNLNGCNEIDIIYEYYRITENKVYKFQYVYDNGKKKYYKQYKELFADFSKRGKYRGLNFIRDERDTMTDGKVVKMTDDEIKLYLDFDYYVKNNPEESGRIFYNKICLQRAEPEKEFLELYADELN